MESQLFGEQTQRNLHSSDLPMIKDSFTELHVNFRAQNQLMDV